MDDGERTILSKQMPIALVQRGCMSSDLPSWFALPRAAVLLILVKKGKLFHKIKLLIDTNISEMLGMKFIFLWLQKHL